MKDILKISSIQKMNQINDIHDICFGISDLDLYRIVIIDQDSYKIKAFNKKIYPTKDAARKDIPSEYEYLDYDDMICQILRKRKI